MVDKNDRNVHDRQEDRKHNKALYDLRGGDELFSSDRDIETISGFEAKNLKHIEGRLIIALPVNPETVTFNADEIGVARTAAGSTITLLNVQQLEDDSFGNKRARVTIHFAGKANSYRGHKGYNLEGKEHKKPVREREFHVVGMPMGNLVLGFIRLEMSSKKEIRCQSKSNFFSLRKSSSTPIHLS